MKTCTEVFVFGGEILTTVNAGLCRLSTLKGGAYESIDYFSFSSRMWQSEG